MSLLLFNDQPPYHKVLLDAAQRYVDAGAPSDLQVGVVFAQMAVEVRAEQAFELLRSNVSPRALGDCVSDRLPSIGCPDGTGCSASVRG